VYDTVVSKTRRSLIISIFIITVLPLIDLQTNFQNTVHPNPKTPCRIVMVESNYILRMAVTLISIAALT